MGEFVHNRLHTIAVHCANGLQQSASELHPYPLVEVIQFFPVAGITTELLYFEISMHEV